MIQIKDTSRLTCNSPHSSVRPQVSGRTLPFIARSGLKERAMCKLCWVLVLVLLVGASVIGYKVFVGPPMESSADGRRVIRLSEQERGLVLIEMRGFLASVQQITAALAANDMPLVAEQARRSGRAAQHAVPPLLIAKLPAPFKKMGFDTHAGFDQLALDAEELGDREHSLAQLADLMQNCVVCHGAYRIDPEPESVQTDGDA